MVENLANKNQFARVNGKNIKNSMMLNNLSHLERVDLRSNKVQTLEEWMAFGHLKKFFLSQNPLYKTLKLVYNRFNDFTDEFIDIEDFKRIFFRLKTAIELMNEN